MRQRLTKSERKLYMTNTMVIVLTVAVRYLSKAST